MLESNKRKHFALIIIILTMFTINFISVDSYTIDEELITYNAEEDTQFPFVNQKTVYTITQSVGVFEESSGTLTVEYLHMINESSIFGTFHVLVISDLGLFYYNETAVGSENLDTRHLYINAKDTYIINLFMVHFFEWPEGEVTPTPMWVFPSDLEVGKSTNFWNYTATCLRSESIHILDKYYEVFIYKSIGPYLNMTLLYGLARNQNSDWYGLLFYMSGSFYDPSRGDRMSASFMISETNVELFPLDELNENTILITTISFYSVIVVGSIIFRLKRRRELVGGEF